MQEIKNKFNEVISPKLAPVASTMSEFKAFAIKGNIIDLAIGVIIGTAFGKIVSSLVSDIIMPPLGFITGGIDFSKFKIVLQKGSEEIPEVAITYGQFLNNLLNFFIVAFVIFMVIKQINRFKKVAEKAPGKTPEEVLLLREIRDLLKK
jgi:large conductance mechanosensitive channel